MTTAAKPDKDETRARIKELHGLGKARNVIARELELAPSTVGNHARAMGLTWDRRATAAATAAKTMDLAARRTGLVERMIVVAEAALDAAEKPKVELAMITQAGRIVKTKRDVDQTDRRNALVSAGIAVDKATKLLDRDTGTATAMSTLDLIEAGIGAAARSFLDGAQTTD